MMRLLRRCFLGCALAAALPLGAAAVQPTLVFGVLNQQSPARTAERWNPVFQYIKARTGLDIQLRMGATVRETNAMMGRGEFDFVFTNHNFRPEYDGAYKVIAALAGKPIFGVIAVGADSPVKTLADLAGKRVAFPSREAFVAYAVPVLELKRAKVDVLEVLASTQDSALAQLKAGAVDAAAVNSRFLTQFSARQGFAYREIYTSEGFAEIPVIAHPRLSAAVVTAVRQALVEMKQDPRGESLLESSGFAGFDPATDKQYDNVRRIYRGN
ncbi:MAG: phosphate/phosphite/phosphonate ABC transporter substrate-binding protein [Betaproteobacteria bacterium]|nr:phosphate/phosphite/phosphonate ABC transporter substrate-binding protein [Betaproteobacteria bacterium]